MGILARIAATAMPLLLLGAGCDVRSVEEPVAPQGDGTAQPEEPEPRVSAPDRRGVGEAARAILSASAPRVVIEVDGVEGRRPGGSLGHLRSVLESVADKPGGITTQNGSVPSSGGDYGRDDLVALERAHRDAVSSGDTAAIYVLYLDGRYADGPDTLGVAFGATSFAIFADAIEEAASLLSDPERLERAVMVHELGHLLRLVNIGYSSPREREDPEHPNHSTNRDSVMHWAIETDAVSQVLDGPPPDDFDEADRADLADIKAGRL